MQKPARLTPLSGFTLIEVLVVIMVIGILASIAFVIFPGIENRARSSQAKTNASAVQKIAESYYEDQGRFPGTTAEFRVLLAKLPTTISLLTASSALSSANGDASIDYDIVGTAGAASGARIRYWDYMKTGGAGIASDIIYLGDATSGSTFANLAS